MIAYLEELFAKLFGDRDGARDNVAIPVRSDDEKRGAKGMLDRRD